MQKIFYKGLKKLLKNKPEKILILGLGGGSVINVLNKLYPGAYITAIEIDPLMIETGKKYLNLDKTAGLKIICGDAFKEIYKLHTKFDLIFVDLYCGYMVSDKISDRNFLLRLQKLLNQKGSIIFNRIYFRKYIYEANEFLDKVQKIFHYVNTAKIYSNILVCVK